MINNAMLRSLKNFNLIQHRTYKHFGHKRQPVPLPTTVWHGFLTFTFIGLGLQWDFISNLMFGHQDYDEQIDEKLREKVKLKNEMITE